MPPWIERSRGIRQVVYGANRAPPLAGGPYGCCVAIVNERAATGRNGVSIVCARNDKLMYEVTDYWFTTENYKMFGYSQYADLIRTINCLEGLHNGWNSLLRASPKLKQFIKIMCHELEREGLNIIQLLRKEEMPRRRRVDIVRNEWLNRATAAMMNECKDPLCDQPKC